MRIQIKAAAAGGLVLAMLATCAAAQTAAPSTKAAPKCFRSHDWHGWKPTPDSKSMYIHVGVNQFYRIDFSDSCPTLQAPNAHLVTKPVNDLICSAIELDLKVADPPGMAVPCIVSNITPLSPADVAALPKKLRP